MGSNFFNLSNSEIDENILKIIISILEDYGNLEINKLIPHLLEKTKNINSKKYKNILIYLKKNHNGFLRFLENYFAFTIIRDEKAINILLNKNNLNLKPFINDWVIIDEDD